MSNPSTANNSRAAFKVFLRKGLFLLVIVFILDFSVGNLLKYFYFKQESGLQYRTSYAMEKTTADVLIFGSSRANHHYYPEVFEDRLHLNYYNAGRDGNYIFYHTAVLKSVLKRYQPKVIFLDFMIGEFNSSQDGYERLSSLMPYYSSHPEVRPIAQLKGKYEPLKLLSVIYPYNSSLFTIAIGNTESNKTRMWDNKGYIPLTKTWNRPVQADTTAATYIIDSTKMVYYEMFIKDCVTAKVPLYVVASPYFISSNHTDYSIQLGRQIAAKYQVPFLDYSRDSSFISSPKLFSDATHLNDEGAKLFSNKLLDDVAKNGMQ